MAEKENAVWRIIQRKQSGKLLNEKPFSQITVRDIVDDCGVNRNTFYYYYQDLPQLMESIVNNDRLFTPERKTEGHSDKVCDRIAGGIPIFEEKLPRERTALVSRWIQ